MAISTNDQRIAAARQLAILLRTAAATSIANTPFTTLDLAGNPGAGSLAIGNTANGVVPTDATAGYPVLRAFGGGNTGYLDNIQWGNTVAGRLILYDRLFNSGSHALTPTGTVNLSAQPSYSGRLPGTAYEGLEIFLEINTVVAASAVTVAVNYTNEAGTTGRSTGASASLSAFTTRRLIPMPLQAGDKGVQKIEGFTIGGTAAATGNFNIVVARRLWSNRVRAANDGGMDAGSLTPNRIIYETSALWLVVQPDSTSTGLPELLLNIING